MQKIDPARWPRTEKFGFFSAVSQPFYSATFRVDVTRLHAYTQRHGLSFYYALVYLATNAVNAVENFRYTVRGGEIFLLDERIPSFTDLKTGSEDFYIVTRRWSSSAPPPRPAARRRPTSLTKTTRSWIPSSIFPASRGWT